VALALTSRRGAFAAGASALAALAIAIGVVGRGCSVDAPGPDAAVHDFLEASRVGDRKAVFDLLSPDTQRHLEENAQAATAKVGASVRYTALDLISIGAFDDPPPRTELRVVTQYGDKAEVEIDAGAGKARLALVRVDGHWRIDLPDYGTSPD
jgi:hypothetical protein